MTTWTNLKSFELPAGPVDAPWLLAIDVIEGVKQIKIVADGEWRALPGFDAVCGPNGHAGLRLADDELVLRDIRVGALIGKLGGSSAGLETVPPPEVAEGETQPPAPPAAFAIGELCLITLASGQHGPLFVGFNTRGRPIDVVRLKIDISGTTL